MERAFFSWDGGRRGRARGKVGEGSRGSVLVFIASGPLGQNSVGSEEKVTGRLGHTHAHTATTGKPPRQEKSSAARNQAGTRELAKESEGETSGYLGRRPTHMPTLWTVFQCYIPQPMAATVFINLAWSSVDYKGLPTLDAPHPSNLAGSSHVPRAHAGPPLGRPTRSSGARALPHPQACAGFLETGTWRNMSNPAPTGGQRPAPVYVLYYMLVPSIASAGAQSGTPGCN